MKWGVDVVEEDVPDARPEDRALEHHVGEVDGVGVLAVDKDDCLACGEVVGEEGEEVGGEAFVAELVEEEWGVHVVEGAFDVREKDADFAAVLEFKDPGVDEKCCEVLCAVVFAEGPLRVTVCVRCFKKSEKWDCK